MKSKKYVVFAVASLAIMCLVLGVYVTLRGDTRKGSPDDLVGWYEMERGDRVIPVFKYDDAYYSASGRGVEVPLKECQRGLEVDRWPFTLVGTTIGFDKGEYFFELRIHKVTSIMSLAPPADKL